ncbi:39S ribosomal protein L53/MRP-L53 [Nitzschia inconspicua]|uniref:Large ribosomal subunit protein mL53 n=1 Tax=Nitzschia inconspicua TaxID=303405 RepID=A0A9K3PEX3_9STRA|nr:39S ribosomal protein L53/MRP-L53 [Nitzschia inconspicua]
MPIKFSKETSSRLFRYVKTVDIQFNPFDNRTKSAREIWRQMQATRFKRANPKLQINTNVSGTAAAPQVVFTLYDDSEMRFDSQNYTASEILFDVHLTLDKLDNEFEMSGKSFDDE